MSYPKLHANRAIIRTLTVTYGTLQKNKRSSVLNLPKQRQVCPSLFFQFNMRISVIYGTLSVSCKRVVRVLSPLASNSCGGSHMYLGQLPMRGNPTQSRTVLDSTLWSLWLPDSRQWNSLFFVSGFGFQIPIVCRIPDNSSWLTDSKAQDSGFQ